MSSTHIRTDTPAAPTVEDYWNALIGERHAAEFLGLSVRSLQGYRQRGGGPRYVRVSSRCIRYLRRDLAAWAEARARTSTSDPGKEDEAA